MIETKIIQNRLYDTWAHLKKHHQITYKLLLTLLIKLRTTSTKILDLVFNFISIYFWYPSLISFSLLFFLTITIIFVSKDIGIHAIPEETRRIINDNLHTFFLTLSGLIITIVLYVGASAGRDSSFDRSRVLFKTFMLFPLIIMISINLALSPFIHPDKLIISYSILILLTLISMIKLFDSILNRQQFECQRKLIAESSMKILHPFLKASQKIILSELSAFASECHLHLSSNNTTFAQSSVDSLKDLTIKLRVIIKNSICHKKKYNMAVGLYKDAIVLCNQILLSSTENRQVEVFKTASYPIKSSVNLYSTDDIELSKILLENISHQGFLLYENTNLRKYFWEALFVCDKHSFFDTAFIEIIEKCNKSNYENSNILIEFILTEASKCIRYCIDIEDLKNFQMIKNTFAYITQNGPNYPLSLSICAQKLRTASRTLAKQHALGILAWTLSKEKQNYEIYFFEFLAMMPKKISSLWDVFAEIVLREDEEKFIWTSTGMWMEGSGTWSGNLYEGGYFKTIIILIFFIDPLVSEDFRFPPGILPDLLDITKELERNYPSKIFKNDETKINEFQSFLMKFRSVIENQSQSNASSPH